LEKMCIVRRSNSGWSSPLHMVPKPTVLSALVAITAD
jgi:hypothetical protein